MPDLKNLARAKRNRILLLTGGLLLAAALAWAFRPEPQRVETGRVERGLLRVSIDEEGRTRVKDRFTLAAPLAGRLAPPALRPGDAVEKGAVIARMTPVEPALLDARAKAQAGAQILAAQAAVAQAGARVEGAREAHEQAERELARLSALLKSGNAAPADLDAAGTKVKTSDREMDSARFGAEVARFQLELARAALQRSQGGGGGEFDLHSPVAGRVLRLFQEGGGVVAMGAPLLELGEPAALEIVTDVLSADAVKIAPGASVSVEDWGGDGPLAARVRRVEPAGFTRVSALGVEEQRVNVISDFLGDPGAWSRLGDGYSLETRIVIWERRDALRVPVGALFRDGDAWAVFAAERGRARLRRVTIGHRNDEWAEVAGGLSEGETVILYPGDRLADGARIRPR
jgi:HlyD family secretion protein